MAKLTDGFSTLLSFSLDASVLLYEKEVTPPGITSGGPIDITTMRNTAWRTQAPKSLKTLQACSGTFAYDPACYDEIMTMMGQNQTITLTFSDGATLAFWGFIDEFTPGACTEGEQPTASITIQPTLTNNSGVETAPDYDPSGTSTSV